MVAGNYAQDEHPLAMGNISIAPSTSPPKSPQRKKSRTRSEPQVQVVIYKKMTLVEAALDLIKYTQDHIKEDIILLEQWKMPKEDRED